MGENYSLLLLDFVRWREKTHPLLKTELINYQQKLAHELRQRAKMRECTSLHQQSALINLSLLVEGERLPSGAVCKKGMLYHRTPGLVPALHPLHFPKNNKEVFLQEPCSFSSHHLFPRREISLVFLQELLYCSREGWGEITTLLIKSPRDIK